MGTADESIRQDARHIRLVLARDVKFFNDTGSANTLNAALGVILLELGLGESVARLDGGALMRNQAYHDPTVMNRKLLQHASLRIGFYGGTRLRDIVTGCLTGEWRGSSIVHQLPDVVMCLMSIAMVLSEEEAQP